MKAARTVELALYLHDDVVDSPDAAGFTGEFQELLDAFAREGVRVRSSRDMKLLLRSADVRSAILERLRILGRLLPGFDEDSHQKLLPAAEGADDSTGENGQNAAAKRHAADRSDQAALGQQAPGGSPSANLTKGGIDVRGTEDVLKTKGKGIVLDPTTGSGSTLREVEWGDPAFTGAGSPDLQNFPGLTPVIFEMNVIPLQDLPAVFLGIKKEEQNQDLSLLENSH